MEPNPIVSLELSCCPECGLPAEVQRDREAEPTPSEVVKVLCVDRHFFCGTRDRLVA